MSQSSAIVERGLSRNAADGRSSVVRTDDAKTYYRLALQHQPNVYGIRSNLAILLEQKPSALSLEVMELISRLQQQDQQLLQIDSRQPGYRGLWQEVQAQNKWR